jgi:hypothetical protein
MKSSKFTHVLVLPILAMISLTKAWDVAVYAETSCESTPTGHLSGSGNVGCTEQDVTGEAIEVSDMGNCIITFYTDDDCQDFSNSYDFGDEDDCSEENWHSYDVTSC